jgi:hypothetical protein
MGACLDAQKLAIDNLNKNIASKLWLTQLWIFRGRRLK